MGTIIDRIVIFLWCMCAVLVPLEVKVPVAIVILGAIIASLLIYFESEKLAVVFLLCLFGIGIRYSAVLVLVPIILYDLAAARSRMLIIFIILPIATNIDNFNTISIVTLTVAGLLAIILNFRTKRAIRIQEEYFIYRDSSKEFELNLEQKNKELMDKQDYEIQVAILDERNRIAREIHDNVGHVISSSLLQVGAINAINRDEHLKPLLLQLKGTLDDGMDNIRKSVHNLHDKSIDLYTQTRKIIEGYAGFNIKLEYDIQSNLDVRIKYCFIAIIKEALSNVAKHSDATMVEIVLREHPAVIQLIIKDNGKVRPYIEKDGIGLKSINDRITAIGGLINIDTQGGFKIFIILNKENM